MKALEGIRVLDTSQFLSGPRCTQILADMGAEVIKIEPPQGEIMRLLATLMSGADKVLSVINRNKKGITLNLQSERGKEIFKELVKTADVFVENFPPGVTEKHGITYEHLKAVNKKLVYASITGFGKTGPLSFKGAFDVIAQATGGIMSVYHTPDRPPGTFFGDLVSGAYAAIGILTALLARGKTGEGQSIDISMQDVMFFHNFPAMSSVVVGKDREDMLKKMGKTKEEAKAIRERGVPFWNSYKAKDGYVAVVALTDGEWKRFMEAIGRKDMLSDEKFSNVLTRFLNADASRSIIEEWTGAHTMDEIVEVLDKAKVPAGQVREAEDLAGDPHLKARNMFCDVMHPRYGLLTVPGIPIKLSETPGEVSSPHPDLGQHNKEMYASLLGYTEEDIQTLKKEGVL